MSPSPQSVSASQMRELDRRAIAEFGIPSLTLMENAGRSTADLLLKKFPAAKRIAVFCGKGNNGGDGFVIARYLRQAGKEAEAISLAKPEDLKDDASINYQKLRKEWIKTVTDLKSYDVVVDALLGIGLSGDVTGDYKNTIELINTSRKPVLAVDIPSGLDADEGIVRGAAVKADLTVTMAFLKIGMLKNQGPAHCGEVSIVDIGLPRLDTPRGF